MVALQGKRGDLSPLMERLLGFVFTQASAIYVEDSEDVIRGEGVSIKSLVLYCRNVCRFVDASFPMPSCLICYSIQTYRVVDPRHRN